MPDPSVSHPDPLHKQSVLALLDRPIAFHRAYATLTGSATAGLFLSQAVYWTRTKLREAPESGGWFWKTQEQWHEETALSRSEQERARKGLRERSFYQEQRRGLPAKLYFHIDLEKLVEALLTLPPPRPKHGQKVQPNHQTAESRRLDRPDPADQSVGFPRTITETTTEMSPERELNVGNGGVNHAKAHRRLSLTPRQEEVVEELETQLDAHSRGAFCVIVSDRGLGEERALSLLREAMELEEAGLIKKSLSECYMDLVFRDAQRQGIDLGFTRLYPSL